jgi:hypothetical protein
MEITPRPSTMRVGETRELSVQVIDRSGRPILGTPVELKWITDVRLANNPVPISFDTPGRQAVVASLGTRVDTLWVHVTESPSRP